MFEPRVKISVGNTNRACLKRKRTAGDGHPYIRHLKALGSSPSAKQKLKTTSVQASVVYVIPPTMFLRKAVSSPSFLFLVGLHRNLDPFRHFLVR